MAYSEKAKALRRCRHVYADDHHRAGQRCRAYAVWGHVGGLCAAHGGRTRGSTRRAEGHTDFYECRTVAACDCAAYAWPHRPGGGLCRWPDPPLYRSTIEAGTHAWIRRPEGLRWGWTPTTRRVIRVRPTPPNEE